MWDNFITTSSVAIPWGYVSLWSNFDHNTPDPQTGLSPAMCLFGRPIKDFIPILPGRYEPHPTWIDTLNRREEALRTRHMASCRTVAWTQHTKQLPPLCASDHVRVQNQIGPHPLKWDKTGWIVEVWQFDHMLFVLMDWDVPTSMHNRKFLRKFVPVQKPKAKHFVAEDFRFLPTITRSTTSVPTTPPVIIVEKSTEQTQSPRPDNLTLQNLAPPSATADGVPPALPPDPPVTISPTPLHHRQLQ